MSWGPDLPTIEIGRPEGAPPNYPPFPIETRTTDRIQFNGQDLILVSTGNAATTEMVHGEVEQFPTWAQGSVGIPPGGPGYRHGWWYYRLRSDSDSSRFFWSPDAKTWRILRKNGEVLELGHPLVYPAVDDAYDEDIAKQPDVNGTRNIRAIFRWRLVRQYDQHCAPNPCNVLIYHWHKLGKLGLSYLTDIYDTPPATASPPYDLGTFAHHTHLAYDLNYLNRATISNAPIWKARPDLHVSRVDVAGNGHDSAKGRRLIRRYTFNYASILSTSFLDRITVEGACGAVEVPIPSPTPGESPDYEAPPQPDCATLPPTNFAYTRAVENEHRTLSYAGTSPEHPPPPNLPLHPWPSSAAFLDVDRDGATDILESRPIAESGASRVYISQRRPDGHPGILFNNVDDIVVDNDSNLFAATDGFTISGPPELANRASIYKRPNNDPLTRAIRKWYLNRESDDRWQWQAGPSHANTAYNFVAAGDIDGNGVVDIMYLLDTGGPVVSTRVSLLGRARQTEDKTYPYYIPREVPPAVNAGETNIRHDKDIPFYTFADMNGDAVADLVTILTTDPDPKTKPFIYYPGNGRGHFACESKMGICTNPPPCPSESDSNIGCDIPWVSFGGGDAPRYSIDGEPNNFTFFDYDRDGVTDIISSTSKREGNDVRLTLRIHHNNGNYIYRTDGVEEIFQGTDEVRVGVADLQGDGASELVFIDKSSTRYLEHYIEQPAGPPGLLNGVYHHGFFTSSTEFAYRSVTDLDQEARNNGKPWKYHSAQPMQIVTSVTATQGGDVGSPRFERTQTTYEYRDPAYDAFELKIQGFREVTSKTDGDRGVRTKYYFSECDRAISESCDGTSDMDIWRPIAGAPYQIDTIGSDTGAVSSTVQISYEIKTLYDENVSKCSGCGAVLPRRAALGYARQVDTYLYDTSPFFPAATASIRPVVTTDYGTQRSVNAEYRTSSPTFSQLRRTEARDIYGNVAKRVDFGRIDGSEPELPIEANYIASKDPNPDIYAFHLDRQTVAGFGRRSGLPTDYGTSRRFVYNSAGDLTDVFTTLEGTLPLVRTHEHGKAVAPPPEAASADGEIAVGHLDYDPFGNPKTSYGAHKRDCVGFDYDHDYQHLGVGTARYIRGCAGDALRDVVLAFDSAFDLPTKLSRADHSVVMRAYDEFGRIKTANDSDPDVVGLPSPTANEFSYFFSPWENSNGTSTKTPIADGQTVTSWSYFDDFGKPIASIVEAGDESVPWMITGAVRYAYGQAEGTFRPYVSPSDPASMRFAYPARAYDTQLAHDEFGRTKTTTDRGRRVGYKYHSLSVDIYDEESLRSGPHAGRYTTITRDGHGRVAQIARQIKESGFIDTVRTQYSYDSAGRVVRIKQASSLRETVRWMQYDSLGRIVLNAEPNTSKGFVRDPQDPAALTSMRAWRYAYDDAGRLVGTSDARGCGKNLTYDDLGRLLTEDYSPCLAHHEPYTPIDAAHGTGAESVQEYDTLGLLDSPGYRGRLTAVADRGAITHFGYDARGRVRETARRLTRPASDGPTADSDFGGLDLELGIGINIRLGDDADDAGPNASRSDRYTAHLFRKTFAYDLANRVVSEDTGADVPELLAGNGKSTVQYAYYKRGLLRAVSSSYGELISSIQYNVDGTPHLTTYGDAAGTVVDQQYDDHDLIRLNISRSKPSLWSKETASYTPADPTAISSLQEVLADLDFSYDGVGNATKVADKRNPDEWPDGAKPRTQTLEYDDLYRLIAERTEYSTSSKTDSQVSPFASEEEDLGSTVVPRLTRAKRSTGFTFSYDYLGNTVAMNDADSTVFDRTALGTITNGDGSERPNQLVASSLGIQVRYDEVGNVVDMIVPRSGECSAFANKCSHHFMYDWDEVGQLVRARRWDYREIPADEPRYPQVPFFSPDVSVRYAYSQGRRVLKSAGTFERHSAEIFSTLRLDNAPFRFGDYEVDEASESAYLGGVAHVMVTEDNLPSMSSSRQHVFLLIGDKLGSTNVVIDRSTGELAENVQYHPYGTVDSDYRPERWGSHREPYQFTAKESDTEVGLTYFGARYYSPSIGRWMSADPLTIHAGGGDLNPYAYVSGAVTRLIDPLGLCGETGTDVPCVKPGSPTPDPAYGHSYGGRNPTRSGACNEPAGCGLGDISSGGGGRQPERGIGTALGVFDAVAAAAYNTAIDIAAGFQHMGGAFLGTYAPPALPSEVQLPSEEQYNNEKEFQELWASRRIVPDDANQLAYKISERVFFIAPLLSSRGAGAGAVLSDNKVIVLADALEANAAAERAIEIHKVVGGVTQDKTTIAVTTTKEGISIVSSSEYALRPAQRALLRPNEMAVVGLGHAEVTGSIGSLRLGFTPIGTAASRGICTVCAKFLQDLGLAPLSPLK